MASSIAPSTVMSRADTSRADTSIMSSVSASSVIERRDNTIVDVRDGDISEVKEENIEEGDSIGTVVREPNEGESSLISELLDEY